MRLSFLAEMRAGRFGPVFALLAAFLVIAVFVTAAFLVRGAIDENATFQRNLRVAQMNRARLLRLQIDEETGLRGYLATGSSQFLDPYTRAAPAFGPTAELLNRSVTALGLDRDLVLDEVALNHAWIAQVALPTLRSPSAGNRLPLQLKGKALVDAFRDKDSALSLVLDAAADRGERRVNALVTFILVSSIAGGILLAALLTWLSISQNRLGEELEAQRRAYLEEKHIADALQQAFLQKTLPDLAKADLHAVYVPAGLDAKVGGDWYDAFELSGNRILFSIGDVAGHGVEAAVVMSRVRQAVLSIGVEETDPAIVLARANEILLMQDSTIVTAVCGILDLARGTMTLANAGHPPAILLDHAGRVEMLGANGPPLGAMDRPAYAATSALASPGSMLVLYTDGLVEYGRDWEAGEARLLAVVRSLDRRASLDPAADILRAIFDERPPVDDVAILTIAFRESPRAAARASVRSFVAPVARANAYRGNVR